MAGYSGTPLVQKIGFKPGTRFWLVDAPKNYRALLGALPEGASEPRGASSSTSSTSSR